MRGKVGKILVWCLAVLLVPVVVAALYVFIRYGIGRTRDRVWLWLLSGAGVYLVIHLFFRQFIVAYLFSHDPVRTIWGWITGYKPPRTDPNGGSRSDQGERPPWIVRIAPFLVPIYTIIAILALAILRWLNIFQAPFSLTAFVVGLTYMFHAVQVAYDMQFRHPDLQAGNLMLNVEVVILGNLNVLILLLMLLPNTRADWWYMTSRWMEVSGRWIDELFGLFT